MEDETQTVETTTEPTEETVSQDRPEENHVIEARKKQRRAEERSRELEKELETIRDKDRSEAERLQKRADEAEKRAQELESATKKMERGGWLRAAASKHDFHDPQDAVVWANLDEIESDADAERFVKDLAKQANHLVKPPEKTPPADKLGRVLQGEQRKEQTPQQARAQEVAEQEVKAVMDVIDSARSQVGKDPISPQT